MQQEAFEQNSPNHGGSRQEPNNSESIKLSEQHINRPKLSPARAHYIERQTALIDLVQSIVQDPSQSEALEKIVNQRQQEGLLLTDLEVNTTSTIDISLVPIYVSQEKEDQLRQTISDLTHVKGAVVEAARSNQDLQEYLLEGLADISKEIHRANLSRLPQHLRLRYDTFTDLGGDYVRQIELNGGEPQGDVIMTKVVEVARDICELYFKNRGISDKRIQQCFESLETPVNQCAKVAHAAYRHFRKKCPSLPEAGNCGVFAFRDPITRAPLSSLSNAEANQSEQYYARSDRFSRSLAFDPFDIIDFEEHTDNFGKSFVVPIVESGTGNERTSIHFIRRLHGEPMENTEVWQTLKEKRPEIYYKFIGKEHEVHNPRGLTVPSELFMNPLNSLMTDKKLDAILTDERLIERFGICGALKESLLQNQVASSKREAYSLAKEKLTRVQQVVSRTRALRGFDAGLFESDNNRQGTLSDDEVSEIVANRAKYVVKLGTLTGHSGTGVFVGSHLDVSEVPIEALSDVSENEENRILGIALAAKPDIADRLESHYKQKQTLKSAAAYQQAIKGLQETLQELNMREADVALQDIYWKGLIQYALSSEQAIIQERADSQKGPVIVASTNGGKGLQVSEVKEYNLDLNPQAFFDEMSYIVIRASSLAKANITGGYGCLVPCFPAEVADKVYELYKELQTIN